MLMNAISVLLRIMVELACPFCSLPRKDTMRRLQSANWMRTFTKICWLSDLALLGSEIKNFCY
jgi:hypothetical protein